MSKFRKIASVLLSAVMIVCMFSISASALPNLVTNAKTIESGKKYTAQLAKNGDCADYKINVKKAGTMKVAIDVRLSNFGFYVFDSDRNKVPTKEKHFTLGSFDSGYSLELRWDNSKGRFKGYVTYDVEPGSYYIRVERHPLDRSAGNGKMSIKVTFPGEGKSSSSSSTTSTTTTTTSSGKITSLAISLKVAETVQLSAVTNGSGKNVKWTSSKPGVAVVSSNGLITAKSAGTAVITAKSGSTKQSITVQVKR